MLFNIENESSVSLYYAVFFKLESDNVNVAVETGVVTDGTTARIDSGILHVFSTYYTTYYTYY